MYNGNLAVALQSSVESSLRAVTLVRVSTADQASEDKAGMDRQRVETARIVRDKGYRVVHSVELVDVSGTATAFAPEIQELLLMSGRREIDVIVVAEMSRLIRPDDL